MDGSPAKGWSGYPLLVSLKDRTGEGDLGPARGMIGFRLGDLPETQTSWWGLELPGLFSASSLDGIDSGLQDKGFSSLCRGLSHSGEVPFAGMNNPDC